MNLNMCKGSTDKIGITESKTKSKYFFKNREKKM